MFRCFVLFDESIPSITGSFKHVWASKPAVNTLQTKRRSLVNARKSGFAFCDTRKIFSKIGQCRWIETQKSLFLPSKQKCVTCTIQIPWKEISSNEKSSVTSCDFFLAKNSKTAAVIGKLVPGNHNPTDF